MEFLMLHLQLIEEIRLECLSRASGGQKPCHLIVQCEHMTPNQQTRKDKDCALRSYSAY